MSLLAKPENALGARLPWGIVGLMIGLSVTSYVNRISLSIASPVLMKEFQLSETEMGSLYSAFILSYAVLMAPGGWLADRFGPRRVLAVSSISASLFVALTAAAGRPGLGFYLGVLPSFLAVRFLFGACTAPLYPACATVTARWIPSNQRGRVQGLVVAGAPLGGAVTPLLFAWAIARYGWRDSFCLAAAATAILGLVWFQYVRDWPAEHTFDGNGNSAGAENGSLEITSRENSSWTRVVTSRNLLLLTLGYSALSYFEYIFFYWMYYYFVEVRRVGVSGSAAYTTVLLLTMTLAMPLGGWVSDRLTRRFGSLAGRRLVVVSGMLLSALLLYLSTNLSHELAVVALLCLAAGLAASCEGPFWAFAIEAGGRHAGAAGGFLNAGGNFGGLLAPILTPYIAGRAGWSWGLHAGSLIVLAGASALFLMKPAQRDSL